MDFQPKQTFQNVDEDGRASRYLEGRLYTADDEGLQELVQQWAEDGLVVIYSTTNNPWRVLANKARSRGSVNVKE